MQGHFGCHREMFILKATAPRWYVAMCNAHRAHVVPMGLWVESGACECEKCKVCICPSTQTESTHTNPPNYQSFHSNTTSSSTNENPFTQPHGLYTRCSCGIAVTDKCSALPPRMPPLLLPLPGITDIAPYQLSLSSSSWLR